MLNQTNRPLNFLRFGLARTKELLRDVSRIYDGLVIPANILLYQYKSTPAIIYSLKQPYFIDPMSYLFAQPFEKFKKKIERGNAFKPSFEKLLIGYGLDPAHFINSNSNLVEYLKISDANLFSFVDNCMDFQFNTVLKIMEEAEELINVENPENLRPAFLIPPYFLFKDKDDYHSLNLKILKYCDNADGEWSKHDIFPMLFIEKEFLVNKQYLQEIIQEYLSCNRVKGYVIWINDFDEREASTEEIENYIFLIENLSKNRQNQIVVLYGGFFSLLLNIYGVDCICHGLAYSEHRDLLLSVSKSSGPAPVRYYISDLHQFLTIERALQILRIREDLMCDCPICQRVLQGNPENVINFENEENLAILHFLYNRNKEKILVSKLDKADILSYLDYLMTVNKDLMSLNQRNEKPLVKLTMLESWKKAFAGKNIPLAK